MPWTKTPEELLCYLPNRLKGIPLSLSMKQVSLSIYILFQGSIPSLTLRPDTSFPLAPSVQLPLQMQGSVLLRWLGSKKGGFKPPVSVKLPLAHSYTGIISNAVHLCRFQQFF